MTAFHIGRKTQYLILLEFCGGHDTESRECRIRVAKDIQAITGRQDFNPRDLFSYDLSLMLESLTDDQDVDVFEELLKSLYAQ